MRAEVPPGAAAAPEPDRLDRRRVYILPTAAGYTLGVMLLVILLGAINYDNALGYLLSFLLGGLVMVAMLHTYRNLAGLGFAGAHAAPVFAGQTAEFACLIDSGAPQARLSLELGYWPGGLRREERRSLARATTVFNLVSLETAPVPVVVSSVRRGWLPLTRVRVESRYPLGILRAWAYFETDARALVYPAPRGDLPLPSSGGGLAGSERALAAGNDDFVGLRPYSAGDPVRAIAWKTLAREQPLMVKRFQGATAAQVWLSWSAAAILPQTEMRLSQITRWVLQANSEGLAFGLELPDMRIDYGRGEAHCRSCLRALALFGEPGT